MVYKVVVSDEDVTYQLELDDKDANVVNGLKIGDEFAGGVLGLKGYKLEITGGSDNNLYYPTKIGGVTYGCTIRS